MRVSDFDYALPDELIARHPPRERRDSRLLVLAETLSDRLFCDLPSLLAPGDLLVFNDTRVIPARIEGRKETGGRVEILIERIEDECTATAQVRVSKALRPGAVIVLPGGAKATVHGRDGDLLRLSFPVPVLPFLKAHGEVPLPPYLRRRASDADIARYQTVYAKHEGAVAAPTAGLHFDEAMLEETRARGLRHAAVTLHVGAGTFKPLRFEHIEDNVLHAERVHVSAACCDAVAATRDAGRRVVAVGTTSVRALETAAAGGELRPYRGDTALFIRPGFRFRVVDALLTNFHLPRSSLLMLVAAFAGTARVLDAYRHAVRRRYRFFSYGDAMFIDRYGGDAV